MATKKKADTETTKKGESKAEASRTSAQEAYEKSVQEFGSAMERFNSGDFDGARPIFEEIVANNPDELVLGDRASTYARICEQKSAPATPEPSTAEDWYYRAVLLSNDGRCDEAIELLNLALNESPSSAKYLFARASAWAIKGNVDAAVSDLRQAITVDPQIRFQAGNDPDFEGIREEPAFIDIIEPTPTGV